MVGRFRRGIEATRREYQVRQYPGLFVRKEGVLPVFFWANCELSAFLRLYGLVRQLIRQLINAAQCFVRPLSTIGLSIPLALAIAF